LGAARLTAVQRQPQQRKSLQSPCLRVTLVTGTRYLDGLKSGTEAKSSPEAGTAWRASIHAPACAGLSTRR
jgi:hypothetical protein